MKIEATVMTPRKEQMRTIMKTEAAVMMPRRDENYHEDRSSSYDAKNRCELS
jgi:hypothetical protein